MADGFGIARWSLALMAGSITAISTAGAALDRHEGDGGVVLRERAEPDRFLLGDWEQPDTFLMTYTETWRDTLAILVQEIASEARVLLLVENGHALGDVDAWLETLHPDLGRRVRSTGLFTDTPWVRDYGPLQVRNRRGAVRWLDAEYVTTRPEDDSAPRRVARRLGLAVEALAAPIDGGAINSNGRGLCVSTLEYFDQVGMAYRDDAAMGPTRDALLRMGCQVLALVPALIAEPTKHSDVFLQFTDPWSVAIARFPADLAAEDAERMDAAARIVESAARAMGGELRVARIPVPPGEGGLYYGYLNGLRLGRDLFLPSYQAVSVTEEHAAFVAWTQAVPTVRVVPVPAEDMFDLEGALHCAALGLDLGATARTGARRDAPRG